MRGQVAREGFRGSCQEAPTSPTEGPATGRVVIIVRHEVLGHLAGRGRTVATTLADGLVQVEG